MTFASKLLATPPHRNPNSQLRLGSLWPPLPSPPLLLARDPFVGGYDGAENVCAKNVSCSLIISDPLDGGKAYDVECEAEQQGRSGDGPITRKTLCKTGVVTVTDIGRAEANLIT